MEEEKKVGNTEDRKLEERKEKIKNWLSNKYNLVLIAILLFSFFLLLYYFFMTSQQPFWWDEAEYMSAAKNWAFDIPFDIHPARPPLLSFLASILLMLGFGEAPIKFILVLLPAWISIFLFYLLVKEVYNKKIALVSSFILSVSWIHLFYAMRFMTDALSFSFGILAFLCFWKGYIKNQGKIYLWLIGFFVGLSFLARLTGILYGVFIVVFLVLSFQFKFLKNKHLWISVFIFLLAISPYLLWDYSYFGNPLAFRQGYGGVPTDVGLGWYMIRHVYDYPELIFFVLFLVGLITLVPMLLSLDHLLLKKDKKYYNDFFMALLIIFILVFFIYYLRSGENRWLMPMSIAIFAISAKGIFLVYNFARKNLGKIITILVVLLILVSGTYFQIKHADEIIKIKKDSYVPVKEAGLWIKENSNREDVILSRSITQMTLYSERKVYGFARMNESEFDALIEETHPRYMMESAFEPNPADWGFALPEKYNNILIPVKVWYQDQTQQQPVLIIYEFV